VMHRCTVSKQAGNECRAGAAVVCRCTMSKWHANEFRVESDGSSGVQVYYEITVEGRVATALPSGTMRSFSVSGDTNPSPLSGLPLCTTKPSERWISMPL